MRGGTRATGTGRGGPRGGREGPEEEEAPRACRREKMAVLRRVWVLVWSVPGCKGHTCRLPTVCTVSTELAGLVVRLSKFTISPTTRVGVSNFSTDLDSGRRPMLKSVEKCETPILDVKIWDPQFSTFGPNETLIGISSPRRSRWISDRLLGVGAEPAVVACPSVC